MKVRLSAAARRDLSGIWDYTAERWNEAQAERYVRLIAQRLDDLANGTASGRNADDIRPGYRRLPVGSHLLFYRLGGAEIEVVRILHRRMDVGQHL